MSYLDLVDRVTLFRSLRAIDEELASKHRASGCQAGGCGGPLHRAWYRRKPRGEGEKVPIPTEFCERMGLCCGWCRQRTLPPSCLFFGRRVYWGIAVVLVTATVQGLERRSIAELCERFGVSRRTVGRWVRFFEAAFPRSQQWQRLRGRVGAEVRDDALPRSLLEWFAATGIHASEVVTRSLVFLAAGSVTGATG